MPVYVCHDVVPRAPAPHHDEPMSPSARVLVVGSGCAGLWAALGAARRLDKLKVTGADVTVVSMPYHDIRVRNYEADLAPCRI